MRIIRRGSELYFPQNYNMVTESIWLFSISVSVGITPPTLQLYKFNSFFKKKTKKTPPILYLFRIPLEPAFVCSCRDISCTRCGNIDGKTTTIPQDQEGGGLHRPSMISPLRGSLTLNPAFISIPSIFLRLWFPERFFNRSRTEVVTEWRCKKKKLINEKNQGQTRFHPLSICSPLCSDPLNSVSSSLHLFPSITLSLAEDSNPIRINIPGE